MIAPNHNVSISSSDLEAVSLGKARGIIDEAAESALIGELVAAPVFWPRRLSLNPRPKSWRKRSRAPVTCSTLAAAQPIPWR
jgi:hypothetical protein